MHSSVVWIKSTKQIVAGEVQPKQSHFASTRRLHLVWHNKRTHAQVHIVGTCVGSGYVVRSRSENGVMAALRVGSDAARTQDCGYVRHLSNTYIQVQKFANLDVDQWR